MKKTEKNVIFVLVVFGYKDLNNVKKEEIGETLCPNIGKHKEKGERAG
ncbi:hypothetical protein [Metabacillus sp. RGM 3146]